MSEGGKRAQMQVDPTRLHELAASSEDILAAMAADWEAAVVELGEACSQLGDATGARDVAQSYADSLADAGEVVTALAQAMGLGVAALVDAVEDAVRADDTVAGELARTAHQLSGEGFGTRPGKGGR